MGRRRFIVTMAMAVMGLMVIASTSTAQWHLGGTYECVGRSIGNQTVKVNCSQEQTRGNRIFTTVANFTIQGPAAKHYLGKHVGCWHIDPKDTRINQDVLACPGVPEWW
jgi:hypothetical protein